MNYTHLNHDEAAYTLFAFKRALRDDNMLPTGMAQFFRASVLILQSKLKRMEEEAKTDPRNDEDYDTFDYGTEPLPGDPTWIRKDVR